jgi:transposase
MEVLYPRRAGLDVHKDGVVAAVRCVSAPRHQEVRSFATTTGGLIALSDWLASHGCTHVAMEATGVYWKPVWHMLEGDFELVLANAQHVHNVPGRKTDVSDAAWIADLLAHGLIRSSFVPPAPIQELRDLTRTRKQLTREISQHSLRLQKILEDANLKVASVLSDILGKSGRAMPEATSPSPPPCSTPATSCSATASTPGTWALTTSIASTAATRSAGSSVVSKIWAVTWTSAMRPEAS